MRDQCCSSISCHDDDTHYGVAQRGTWLFANPEERSVNGHASMWEGSALAWECWLAADEGDCSNFINVRIEAEGYR